MQDSTAGDESGLPLLSVRRADALLQNPVTCSDESPNLVARVCNLGLVWLRLIVVVTREPALECARQRARNSFVDDARLHKVLLEQCDCGRVF